MICHTNKLIFLHIPSTGGTSIETALVGKDWFYVQLRTKHLDWMTARRGYAQYWESYFKFSVVRNPWDWMVALYHTHGPSRKAYTRPWTDYLREPFLAPWEPKIPIQNAIMGPEMDYVLRFEHLNEDFTTLCQKAGIPAVALPHVQINEKRRHYSSYYTDEEVEIVRQLHKEDIARFGYEFLRASPATDPS